MSKTREQRLRRVLETMTRQHDRLRDPPAYGSWLLGWVSERPLRRRVRIQIILTIALITANLVGIGLAVLLENVAFPTPSIVSDAPLWITFVAGPAYTVIGMALGSYYVKVQTLAALRWASEEHTPSRADQRNTLLAPLRVAVGTLILWAVGAALFTTLYGLANRLFIPQVMFSTLFCGVLVATACYMLTEFALRPVAAQALEAGLPPGRFALGIIGRTMVVWLLSSGVPLFGIALLGILEMVLQNFTDIQFAYGVLIVSSATLIGGFLLMWIMSWLTAAPVRVVRAALKRVEQGDLRGDLVVFDGTELGELQRGFNAMVNGLRERERVRDLFGRHVGREVAAAAERERPQLGGEDRHAAVVFVDIVGSTQLVDNQPAAHVVKLLNRFFRDRRQRGRPSPRTDQQVRRRRRPGHLRSPEPPRPSRRRRAGRRPGHSRSAGQRDARGPSRHRGGGRPDRRRQCRRQAKIRIHSGRQAGQPGGPIVRTGQITPRAIASILGHTARCQRNRACPLVFGRDGDAART